jgi:regulator of sigma E protease
MAGKQAQKGPVELLNFMALISVNLAVLNLLPIPILDGGHIFFFLIEAILGRPLSLKKIELAQKVGLLALLSLMVVVFYNDIMRLDWSSITSWFVNLWSRL